MKEKVRQQLVYKLWDGYKSTVPFYSQLFNNEQTHLDHFALIDLPSENSGITHLQGIFSKLGFVFKGTGYIPEKQNPFIWMREENHDKKLANATIAQPVIADFKLSELSWKVRGIVEKYATTVKILDKNKLEFYEEQIDKENETLISEISEFIYQHLIDNQRALITYKEYNTVLEENELLAWVLAYGRVVNHFGVSIHLLRNANSLAEFNNYIIQNNIVKLNSTPSVIKGGEYCGIAQSSSQGLPIKIRLNDEEIITQSSFLEFVWRYPFVAKPTLAEQYYQDFIPQNANLVIESLYRENVV